MKRPVEIFGVAMDLGQDRRGVDMGPSAIRYARFTEALEDLGYSVTDLGNAAVPIPELIPEEEEVRHLGEIRKVCTEVAGRAKSMVSGGAFPDLPRRRPFDLHRDSIRGRGGGGGPV